MKEDEVKGMGPLLVGRLTSFMSTKVKGGPRVSRGPPPLEEAPPAASRAPSSTSFLTLLVVVLPWSPGAPSCKSASEGRRGPPFSVDLVFLHASEADFPLSAALGSLLESSGPSRGNSNSSSRNDSSGSSNSSSNSSSSNNSNSSTTMALLRPLRAGDLHALELVNGDVFTETFGLSFYLKYLSAWPELCIAAEAPDGALLGYIIGKVEGEGDSWHGHVTALSVSPESRSCGLAGRLLDALEAVCRDVYKCFFVDLFARMGNQAAVSFYSKRGYFVHKTEKGYYSGKEDALDMRKLLQTCKKFSSAQQKKSDAHALQSYSPSSPALGSRPQADSNDEQQQQGEKGKKKRGKRSSP
ncbi:hypothetical protein Esti_001202 [Eimeria stiedai]